MPRLTVNVFNSGLEGLVDKMITLLERTYKLGLLSIWASLCPFEYAYKRHFQTWILYLGSPVIPVSSSCVPAIIYRMFMIIQ